MKNIRFVMVGFGLLFAVLGSREALAAPKDGGKGTIGIVCVTSEGDSYSWPEIQAAPTGLIRSQLEDEFEKCVESSLDRADEDVDHWDFRVSPYEHLPADRVLSIAGFTTVQRAVEKKRVQVRKERRNKRQGRRR